MSFTHLHLHTTYSLLDGVGRIDDMVLRAKELKQDAMAITDHGVLFGAIEFFKSCVTNGIKPIIGCEVYVTNHSRLERISEENRYHLILLAENSIGYKNLIKIVSIGFEEGFYYKPRVDYEILKKYHEGIICLTACIAGEIPSALVNDDYERAKLALLNYIDIFGKDNVFLEIQNHYIKEEIYIQPQLIRLSKELDVPLVATNDVHYTLKNDSFAHDCIICLQTQTKLDDADRKMKYEPYQFYLKSEEEMRNDFKFCEEAVDNTDIIAKRCNVFIEFTKTEYNKLLSTIESNLKSNKIDENHNFSNLVKCCNYFLPSFNVPDGYTNETYFKYLIEEGLKNRYEVITDEIIERIDFEFNIIKKMGFIDYFLIVWDYINYAKTNKIPVGPGRGSSVGSLIAFVLKITNIDPLKYGLYFERFLNPGRVSMPDIDSDFSPESRDDIINYLKQRYGERQVSNIVTFGRLGGRNIIRDLGRVMGVPHEKTDKISVLIPNVPTLKLSLDQMINEDIEKIDSRSKLDVINFREAYNNDDIIKNIVDTGLRIEDIKRNSGVHASGVLITPSSVDDYTAIAISKKGFFTTQNTMTEVEELGLLKMDILGLRNLTIIKNCLEYIKTKYKKNIDLDNLDLDDQNVYKMISDGDTLGIFQLESLGMTNFMKKLKPTCLEDIIAGISLYRPGPMQNIPRFVDSKHNQKEIKYECKELEPILKNTYGIMVYQEHLMQIVQALAGYTIAQADEVRKAVSKKNADVLMKHKKDFVYGNEDINVKGCIKNGIDENVALKLFDDMAEFAGYGFNKSHAAAYAMLAYQMAYLKYYYRLDLYTSMLNTGLSDRKILNRYVNAIEVDILPVDINKSQNLFSVDGNNIRMGIGALKGVGFQVAYKIIEERDKNGLFKSYYDAVSRLLKNKIQKATIEKLVLVGAFDEFDGNRMQKVSLIPIIEGMIRSNNKDKYVEGSLFDMVYSEDDINDINLLKDNSLISITELPEDKKLFTEKEIAGIYLHGHPLKEYQNFIDKNVNCNAYDFDTEDFDSEVQDEDTPIIESDNNMFENKNEIKDGDKVKILGVLEECSIKMKKTRYAILDIDDMYGNIRVMAFERVLNSSEKILFKNNIIFIEGRVQYNTNRNKYEIIADGIRELNRKIWIRVDNENKLDTNFINDIKNKNIGKDVLCVYYNNNKKREIISDNFNINDSSIEELKKHLGDNNIAITYN